MVLLDARASRASACGHPCRTITQFDGLANISCIIHRKCRTAVTHGRRPDAMSNASGWSTRWLETWTRVWTADFQHRTIWSSSLLVFTSTYSCWYLQLNGSVNYHRKWKIINSEVGVKLKNLEYSKFSLKNEIVVLLDARASRASACGHPCRTITQFDGPANTSMIHRKCRTAVTYGNCCKISVGC